MVSMTSEAHLRAVLQSLANGAGDQIKCIDHLTENELLFLLYDWPLWARSEQLPPPLLEGKLWHTWLFLGGRGAGKTRAGSEWVRGLVYGAPWAGGVAVERLALVAATYSAAREIMVEGESGLMGIHPPHQRPTFIANRRRLEWPNGAVAELFSAEDPEALRGPQFGAAWLDELAKWHHADETWDMLQFGLRLGAWPRQLVTTTPRSVPLIHRLLKADNCRVSRASTQANKANLAPGFLKAIVDRYGQTRMGRQEIDGEVLEDRDDALWNRRQLEALRCDPPSDLSELVVAVDPPAGGAESVCGLVVVGKDDQGTAFVLDDGSLMKPHPEAWVGKAAELFHTFEADALIAESNHGGNMIEALFRNAHPEIPLRLVRATRGKRLRAEPVAELYARGKVKHAGAFPELEDQMCQFGLDGLSDGRSPDRLDALVWAVSYLMMQPKAEPRIRSL